MPNKTVLIWGCTGQDGSMLADFLLTKNYEVVGVKRRTSTNNTQNIIGILNNPNFTLIEGDIVDPSSVNNIITKYKVDECYNLAAQSHVFTSFEQPSYTWDVDARGPLFILEAIRRYSPKTKYYQADTSEMFGNNYSIKDTKNLDENGNPRLANYEKYQNEDTPLSPNSPYAIAKTAAHHTVRMYREAYGIFACAGILFNHESERRGENFVTRKITKYAGQLDYHLKNNSNKDFPLLKLGNIDAVRDWGYAGDYVKAMWLMLQQDTPDDYIVGTGEGHTIKEFLEEVFRLIGQDYQKWIEIDQSLYRPLEVPYLRCDASKAKRVLGWQPEVTFKELVKKMVDNDKII